MEQDIKALGQSFQFILIDDDHINNFCAQAMIKNVFGKCDIKAFTDPEVGLAYLQKEVEYNDNLITILFLDINMPVLTGWDVLEAFEKLDKRIQQQVNVYIVSSSVDQRDEAKAMSYSSVSGFISKPLRKDFHEHLDIIQFTKKLKSA